MRDATTAFAIALVDEWARGGVTDAVVAPGSRSAPLALALARDPRVAVHMVLDERSAAFRALGIGLATGRPAVVCCTSGTAAVNLHAAVVEAHYARVPLLVCTADRPPELHDVGAGQTIDQTHLFGRAVRWFADAGPPADVAGAGAAWRALACRAVAAATGSPPGPVHLNLPFREPLAPTGAPLVEAPGRDGGAPWVVSARAAAVADAAPLAELVGANPRGLLVAGWGAGVDASTATRFAEAAGWPVLADPLSGLRSGPHAVSAYEALLRVETFATEYRPDLVVRIGAPLTSKLANAWLDPTVPQVLVDPDGVWLDPDRAAARRVVADPETLLSAITAELGVRRARRATLPWLATWLDAERRARDAIDRVLDAAAEPFEGVVARDVAASVPDGSTLLVASSLPVRALEWCMAPRSGVRVLANRGANGIDGFVSTAIGVANTGAPTVAFCGDLCFLHDSNGLLGADAPVTFVVVDNDGGGIFSFLPHHELPEFETLFGTPHGLDLVAIARAYGAQAERVSDLSKLHEPHDGVRVLVVPVDRHASVDHHRALWDAVRNAVRDVRAP